MSIVVQGVADWLGLQLVEEAKLLYGVKGKVEQLQRQLRWMESCYRDAQAHEYNSSLLNLWVEEVNELANESRIVIQKYLDKVASSRQPGCIGNMNRPLHMICSVRPRHEVNSGIDDLMQKMSILDTNLHIFGFGLTLRHDLYKKSSSLGGRGVGETIIEGVDVAGLEKYVGEVADELLGKGVENTVVALYGPRGIGKTTLAKMVCQRKDVKKNFHGLISWTHVSRGFGLADVLGRLLSDLDATEKQIGSLTEKQLVNELRKVLQQKRCLVVLDDLWSLDLLDYLKPAFSIGMHSGSKVLLTSSLEPEELHKFPYVKAFQSPKCLSHEESWKILEISLGGPVSDPEMKNFGGEMLKNCKGLPSDIVMLGTILKGKTTPEEWISAYLSIDDPLRNTSQVLQSSYNKLANHLKPCLLHLGNFPEEYEISVARLFRMWIAEGFVPLSNWASASDKSLEDTASDYLKELAEKNFVAVTKRGSNLRIKSCLLHDLVRNFCLQKGVEEGFVNIIDRHAGSVEPLSASSATLNRMTVHLDQNSDSFLPSSNDPCKDKRHLKSLIIFPLCAHMESNYQQWLEQVCSERTRLRVLDLEGLYIRGSFPGQIENMVFLRYLSLKGTIVSNVPSSIGNLRFLQTLDLRVSFGGEVVIIPNTLWKIPMLMFLFLPAIPYEIEGAQVLKLDTLSTLETLKNLDATMCHIQDLLALTKIRRLSLKACKKDSLKVLLSSPFTSSRLLQRFSVAIEGVVISQEPSILSSCECLYRLSVEGRILTPLRHDIFPPYLEVLTLEASNLENDPMPVLGYIPNLRRLCLGKDSFLGDTMVCSADGFVQLRELTFASLPNIQKWILESAALPVLKQLVIDKCDKLSTLPDYFPSYVLVTRNTSNGGEIEEYIS